MDAERALEALKFEIEALRARCEVTPSVIEHLRAMDGILFGFGFYDAGTERDHELWKMLEPHMKALKEALKF